jgi:5-methylcytosine-specific restriction endonuclease McrA
MWDNSAMSYERTPEHRARMSEALKGKPHIYRSASTKPEVASKIASWWTPERREAKRQAMLARNPQARYHGLSASEAAKLRASVGACQNCGATRADGRLDIHHRDRDKRNQAPENLAVLCHRCHMQIHSDAGEMGWSRYHRKRN